MRTVRWPGETGGSRALRSGGALLFSLLALTACGKKGPPRPPLPRGPLPPRAVEARQLGGKVLVSFQVSRPRGPKPAQEPVRAELVRVTYRPGIEASPDPEAFRRRGETVVTVNGDPLAPGSVLHLTDPTVGDLEEQGVGWTLRYGVRVLDRRGRSSPLVVAEDLHPVQAPDPPSDLRAEATADGVRLEWRTPPGAAQSGEGLRYNVYRAGPGAGYGERPLNPTPLTSTEYLDDAAETGKVYRYKIRVALSDGTPYRESESSAEVAVLAADRFPPAAPGGLVAVQEKTAVRLFWNPNRERDLAGYRVYRRTDDGPWNRIGDAAEARFLDRDVPPGQRAWYRITAVDRADPPNESSPSKAADVLVAAEPPGAGQP